MAGKFEKLANRLSVLKDRENTLISLRSFSTGFGDYLKCNRLLIETQRKIKIINKIINYKINNENRL